MRYAAQLDPERLRSASINPATGLAVHYLNHYNEIATKISTLGQAAETLETVLDWRPVGYAAHFRTTSPQDRDLAIAAYEAAPDAVKARFLAARREVELTIMEVQDLIEAAPEATSHLSARAPEIFAAIKRLGSIIERG